MKTQRQGFCDTALELGLAVGGSSARGAAPLGVPITRRPSLTLSLSDDDYGPPKGVEANRKRNDVDGRAGRVSPPHSTVSSFSTVSCPSASTVKKEKGIGGEEAEADRASSRASDDDEDDGVARKKLRLTKEQYALLEDRFKEQSTLTPKQKQALAKQLNLRPRQVEVWFQNRRARTKLKQTEVDCEFLKRCCEKLTEENRRLLQELKDLKFAPPLCLQFTTPTLSMCPSCERMGNAVSDSKGAGNGASAAVTSRPFAAMAQKTHFFNPFTHSTAC